MRIEGNVSVANEDDVFRELSELDLAQALQLLEARLEAINDHKAFGVRLSDEALEKMYADPAISLKLAEVLISFGDLAHHASSRALGLKAKGDVLRVLGLHQAAMDALDEAGAEFLHLKDEENWAKSRITWITACAWLGDPERSLREAARAREAFLRIGEYYWMSVLDSNVAVIYSHAGRYQEAFDLCKETIKVYRSMKDQDAPTVQRAIAVAEATQGEILSLQGQFGPASNLLAQAQKRFIDLKETSLVTHVEMRLADIDLVTGYYGSALQRYYISSDRLQQDQVDDPLALAELKLKMANCQVKLNRAREACQLGAEAAQILRARDVSLETANGLREYAHVLISSRRLKEAVGVLDEARSLLERVGFAHSAVNLRMDQAEISLELLLPEDAYVQARSAREYFKQQSLVERSLHACLAMVHARVLSLRQTDELEEKQRWNLVLAEATSLCKQAIHQAARHKLREGEYRGYWLLGQLAMEQGKYQRAWRYHKMAITLVEEMLENLRYDLSPAFLHSVWPIYENAVYLALLQGEAAQALTYLERARSNALRQYLQKSQAERSLVAGSSLPEEARVERLQMELKDWQNKHRQYVTLLMDQERLTREPGKHEQLAREVQQCEAKIEELFELTHIHEMHLSRLPRANAALRDAPLPQLGDARALQQCLAEDQVVLSYFLYQEKLLIFIVSSNRLTVYENPRGRVELEDLLPFLYASLEPGSWPDVQHPPQRRIQLLLKKLYDLLFAPIEARLSRSTSHLTIVPYGPLHRLPFHALHDGSRFLIERFQINYLPASNMQLYFSQRQSHSPRKAAGDVLFTNPSLVLGYSGQHALQYCLDEAHTVADLLRARCYLEQEATIARLSEQTSGSPLIHIATHGHARLDAPNFSSILLADGQLNAIDAFSLDLRDCQLVTLSGCETGLSLSGGGDEQLGLGRAFLAAGARSLVISLWPVEDRATCELMREFYLHLLRGASRMQALQAAQCTLLHSAHPMYTHPYFWAAFRLVGEPGPLLFSE